MFSNFQEICTLLKYSNLFIYIFVLQFFKLLYSKKISNSNNLNDLNCYQFLFFPFLAISYEPMTLLDFPKAPLLISARWELF